MDWDVCYSLCSPFGTRLEHSTARDGRRWHHHCPPQHYKEVSRGDAQCLISQGHSRMCLAPAEP